MTMKIKFKFMERNPEAYTVVVFMAVVALFTIIVGCALLLITTLLGGWGILLAFIIICAAIIFHAYKKGEITIE